MLRIASNESHVGRPKDFIPNSGVGGGPQIATAGPQTR